MKRQWRNHTKRRSLMSVLLVVLLASNIFILVLTSFIWLPVMHRQLQTSSEERIQEMMLQTVSHVESQMEAMIHTLHTAGSMLQMENLSGEEQVRLLWIIGY